MVWRVVLGSLPSIQGSHRSTRIERDADIMTHLITKFSLLLYWAAYCAFETLGRLSCVTFDSLVGFVVEIGRLLAWLDIVLVHVTGTSRGTVVCENIGCWSHLNISNQSIGEVVTKERKRHEIVLAVICSRRGVTPITESGMLHTSFYDSFVSVIIFVLNFFFRKIFSALNPINLGSLCIVIWSFALETFEHNNLYSFEPLNYSRVFHHRR